MTGRDLSGSYTLRNLSDRSRCLRLGPTNGQPPSTAYRRAVPALWRAVRAWQDDVEAKTCHFLVVPQRIEFSQVDANNWRSVETGLCATAVRTLSRKSGLWTYHTTRTVRPNSAPCAEPGKTTTTTYDPLIGEERELRCRYWR